MRIAHIADIHLRLNQRHGEYRLVFRRLFKQLKEQKPDRIVLAGDLVHSKVTMSPELISIMTFLLNGLRRIAPLDILPGNHDLNMSNKDRMDALTPVINVLKTAKGNLHPINYYTKTGLYEVPDTNIVYAAWSMMDNKDLVIEDKDPDKVYVGLFHGAVRGSVMDNNYQLSESDASVETFKQCDIVLLGDIHKRQGFGEMIDVIIEEIVTEDELERLKDQEGINNIEVLAELEDGKDLQGSL
jgi:DNA repair exonuclease SbcCD nuclease subunit